MKKVMLVLRCCEILKNKQIKNYKSCQNIQAAFFMLVLLEGMF